MPEAVEALIHSVAWAAVAREMDQGRAVTRHITEAVEAAQGL